MKKKYTISRRKKEAEEEPNEINVEKIIRNSNPLILEIEDTREYAESVSGACFFDGPRRGLVELRDMNRYNINSLPQAYTKNLGGKSLKEDEKEV